MFAALAFVAALQTTSAYPRELEADRRPSFSTGGNVLFRHAQILTATGSRLEDTDLLVQNGKIAAIGKALTAPTGIKVLDLTGKTLTPGLVDAHSHRGADDINEIAAISAEVRMQDMINADQEGVYQALTVGITSGLLLHGSANPIGGQSIVVRHKYRHAPSEVIFPGAPRMIKFALGENVKGWSGARYPNTRMGVETVYRRAFNDAKDYIATWDAYNASPTTAAPRRDLRLETLADILRGKIRVQCHSYRQDEMLMMVRLSQEFGFNLTLQHALESYKIAPELAKAKIPVSIFSDGFAYKLEVVDSIPMAAAILDEAGVLVSINTDTFSGTAPLAQDAAKAIRYGVSPDRALRMITINAATELGIQDRVGTVEVGKDADLAVWDGTPLSSYAKCLMTFIDGEAFFERRDAHKIDASSVKPGDPATKAFDPDRVPFPKAAFKYLITGATVHPVSGPVLTNANVLIENGLIKAIGTVSEGGAVTVDGRGLHVYPGFIDTGSKLGLTEFGQVSQATDANELGEFTPDLKATIAVNPQSVHFPKVRYNGITTAVVYPSSGLIAGQSGIIRTIGSTNEDMTVNGTFSLGVVVPEGLSNDELATLTAAERDDKLDAVKRRRQVIVDYFEGARRYFAAKTSGANVPTDSKLESIKPYLAGERAITFTANGVDAINWVLETTRTLKLTPIIDGGRDAWKVGPALKAARVPVLLSPPVGQCPSEDPSPATFDPYDTNLAGAALLRRAGVKFAFKSDDWESAMNLPYRVGRSAAFGLPHDAAIRALTLDAAQILGLGDKLGSLQPGKVANVIVTDGDPLDVTTSLRYLFMDGKPVRLESHYTDLYREYHARNKKTR